MRPFFQPAGLEDLTLALAISKEHNIPYFLLGGGNNILVADDGIEGVVIKLGASFAQTKYSMGRKPSPF